MKAPVALPRTSAKAALHLRLLAEAREKRPIRIVAPQPQCDPLSAANRAYLKALREAEMAVWNRSNPARPTNPAPETSKARTPKSDANTTGSWVLWTWVACAGLTLFQNLRGSADLSATWHHFAAVLSQFLG